MKAKTEKVTEAKQNKFGYSVEAIRKISWHESKVERQHEVGTI